MIRFLPLICLFLMGCEPQGPADGPCTEGERTCAGDQEFQECVDGEWTDASRCPPEGEPPLDIITYCNDGLCTP